VLRLVCWGALIVRPGQRLRQLVSNVVYEFSCGCSRGPRRCRAAVGGGGRRVSWRVEAGSATVEDAGAEGACMNKSGGSNLEAASRGSWESVRKQGTDSIRVLGVHVELGWCKLRCSKRVAWDA
jgi:hypothetical protein